MITNLTNILGSHNSGCQGVPLQVRNKKFAEFYNVNSLTVSLFGRGIDDNHQTIVEPCTFMEGKIMVWLIGEIYKCDWLNFEIGNKTKSEVDLVSGLFDIVYNQKDWSKLASVDGQFVIIIFDRQEDSLLIVNDRFGGIPLYYSSVGKEFLFSTSLNSIATLPNFDYRPDTEAVVESVSFGGFRLGDRTTVENIKMLPWSSVLTWKHHRLSINRYWNPQDTCRDDVNQLEIDELIEKGFALWQSAIARRLVGLKKPGQTLSGGLDSRAILAEVHDKVPEWTSISFGIPRCDDVRYASRCAESTGIRWIFHPLYYGFREDWLEQRSQYIWESDGMVDFSNLLHWESLPLQEVLMDGHISGFIGDAICGGSLDRVNSIDTFIDRLPYYSTNLGLTKIQARQRVSKLKESNPQLNIKFLFYEAKVSQQTNLLFQAPFQRIKVRKPFVDYEVFDFFESLPNQIRSFLYPTILLSKYPSLFKNIPNQKTGMPVMTADWRINLERAKRLAYRKTQPLLKNLRFPCEPRVRNFVDDYRATKIKQAQRILTEVLLSPNSLVVEIFGKEKLAKFINLWFDSASVPSNALGAIFSFELYHQRIRQERHF